MTVQLSVRVRNARLDAIESTIGVSAKLEIFSGSPPASCATATSGVKLAEFDLGADWAAAASLGVKNFNALPLTSTGIAGGNAGYFRIFDNSGADCDFQGTVTATGGGGDMVVDNASIAVGQPVNVLAFEMNEPNA